MNLLGALMGFWLLSGGAAALPMQAAEIPSYPVTLTAYNAVAEQTDSDPHITASGMFSNPEVVAARSRDLATELPFGTVIEISVPSPQSTCGYGVVESIIGYRIVADTMNARFTDRVDVLFAVDENVKLAGKVKNAGKVLGVCNGATVRPVGFVDLKDAAKVPKTQAELANVVEGFGALALRQ